ncbi:MAG: hypothetical protein M1818_008160 [Claussenomyces sp. TS43310]|nr:MAG: hypothetical protein M1818_008160 [Claussenomyces sp. TS43310]
MEDANFIIQAIGRIGNMLYEERDLIQAYSHMILAALFPIYIGAHASLRCPPRVAIEKKRGSQIEEAEEEDDDDELNVESAIEGLTPSDAILFPVLASLTLTGLYFIIKWLEDPALLNQILGWYFSSIGVVGVGRLAGDCLNVGTTFIFPTVWSSGKNSYHVKQSLRKQFFAPTKPQILSEGEVQQQVAEDIITPLPGLLSKLRLPSSIVNRLWDIRALFTDKWIMRAYVHGLTNIKSRVCLNDAIGLVFGAAAIVLYNFYDKAWWLTNLMAFGFCYGTLQLMSPTTFGTGSLVLMGLFVYDVIMVFFTPLMVTVATSLDAPIKLVFPGAKRGGMLGLGDVVLPGLVMAQALRFDLYMHYLRKQRALAAARSDATSPEQSNGDTKPTYHTATGFYGERFWASPSIFSVFKSKRQPNNIPDAFNGGHFKKPYFYASVTGYVLGMLVTVLVLNVYNHAQPALLYLVPGVLGSIWGTSVIRGELKDMWEYNEGDPPAESSDGQVAREGQSRVSKQDGTAVQPDGSSEAVKKRYSGKRAEDHAHHIVLLSLTSPRSRSDRTDFVQRQKTE